jgi:capsid portal protein
MLLFLRKGGRKTLGGGGTEGAFVLLLLNNRGSVGGTEASGGHEISPSSSPISPSSVVLLKDIFTQYYS